MGATLRRLLGLMRRGRVLLALAVGCGTLAALLSLSPYLAVALTLVELLEAAPDWTRIGVIGLMAAGGVLGEKLMFATATSLSHAVAFAVQRDLRFRLAHKLERMPLGAIDGMSKGEIRTALVDDIETLEDAIAHLVPEASAALIAPAVTLLAMMWIDWRLAVLLVLPIAVGLAMLGRMMKAGEGPTRGYFSLLDRLATVTAEFADSLATVRAFNQDEQATARARRTFAELTRFTNTWVRDVVVPGTTAQVLLSSHLLCAGPVGLVMVAAGWTSTATFAAFLAVAYGFGDLFGALQGISHRATMQVRILDRLEAIAAAPELAQPRAGKQPSDASVTFRGVRFAYGTREVLSDIDVKIAPGGFLALVGPSGSGKSTLAKLIARFHDVSAGAIQIGGADVRDIRPDDLHRHVAYVFQDVFLFGGTIADNIRLGRADASDAAVVAAARSAQAHDFIERLPQGYQTLLGERGLGLSGGERQRLSIARAILKNAPILVLDEATAFADPQNEVLIQNAIAQLVRGRTLIVIAHRLHTVVRADEVVVLDGGRVAERGRHDDLLAAGGLYARLWQAQQATRHYRHRTPAT